VGKEVSSEYNIGAYHNHFFLH